MTTFFTPDAFSVVSNLAPMSITFFSIQVMEIDIMGKSIDENRPVPVLRAEDRAVAWHGMGGGDADQGDQSPLAGSQWQTSPHLDGALFHGRPPTNPHRLSFLPALALWCLSNVQGTCTQYYSMD